MATDHSQRQKWVFYIMKSDSTDRAPFPTTIRAVSRCPGRSCLDHPTPNVTMSDPRALPIDVPPEPQIVRAQRLDAARRELIAATERGEGGRQTLRQYSHRMDALVQQLFAEAGSAAQPV